MFYNFWRICNIHFFLNNWIYFSNDFTTNTTRYHKFSFEDLQYWTKLTNSHTLTRYSPTSTYTNAKTLQKDRKFKNFNDLLTCGSYKYHLTASSGKFKMEFCRILFKAPCWSMFWLMRLKAYLKVGSTWCWEHLWF